MQGQEEQRVNAMAQQKAAQEQEMNALRMQQVRGTIGQQEREVKSQAVAQKTAMFRDRLLRAPNAAAARDIIKRQYADPDVGAVLSQVVRWTNPLPKCQMIRFSLRHTAPENQWTWPNGLSRKCRR